ncbi:MAG: uridine kinase [Pyrinomonadaceae bacterium]|nr:uridine kinase [Pyrinomonadaceae bacterium]
MIIGICGGSGSGKTTTAQNVIEKVGADKVVLLEQDSYYLNLADIPLDERRQANFDHPDAIDFDSLADNLESLSRGEAVEIPIYDFATHTRSDRKKLIEPKQIVIIEGILIFTNQRILDLLDLRVFIDTPDDLRLLRRIRRDIEDRGRTLAQTLDQYEKTIRPMHHQFVEPYKRFADVIVPESRQKGTITSMLCGVINQKLAEEMKTAVS